MTDYLYRWCQFCQGKTRILLPPSPDKKGRCADCGTKYNFRKQDNPNQYKWFLRQYPK